MLIGPSASLAAARATSRARSTPQQKPAKPEILMVIVLSLGCSVVAGA